MGLNNYINYRVTADFHSRSVINKELYTTITTILGKLMKLGNEINSRTI